MFQRFAIIWAKHLCNYWEAINLGGSMSVSKTWGFAVALCVACIMVSTLQTVAAQPKSQLSNAAHNATTAQQQTSVTAQAATSDGVPTLSAVDPELSNTSPFADGFSQTSQ